MTVQNAGNCNKETAKAVHPTAMWRYMTETPGVASGCLKGQVAQEAHDLGKALADRKIARAYLFGCGTSHFAAIATAYALNELSGIDSDSYEAFEFARYRLGPMNSRTAALGFSHSGRTKVACEAATAARRLGALTAGFTDNAESPLAKATGFLVEGGPGLEPVGPKTRSFVNTVMMGYQVAASVKGDALALKELEKIGPALEEALKLEKQVKELAERFAGCKRALVVGGGANWATAQEIALKFKESVPLGAEGMEVEDSLHGPAASLDESTLVIGISTEGSSYDKVGNACQCAAGMGCPVISVTNVPYGIDGVETVRSPFSGIREVFSVPLLVLPGYMLVYFSSLARGNNPDGPRRQDPRYMKARGSIPKVSY